MSRVTFYGHFTGWSSYPTVCRAIAKWLWSRKVDLEICDLREAGRYEDVEGIPKVEDRVRMGIQRRVNVMSTGGHADPPSVKGTSLLFSFPEWAGVIPRHERAIGYHVGDVDRVPRWWVDAMNEEDIILTPSSWCREVFTRCGVERPVHVVNHGVSISKSVSLPEQEKTTVLRHFSSGRSAGRKGTRELLAAIDAEEGSPLRNCVVGVHIGDGELLNDLDHGGGWPTRGMRVVREDVPRPPPYMEDRWFSCTDILVQPSRGEGFGLIPLEGLAAGLPVVMTLCTGHAEYADETTPGVVPVPVEKMTPCDGPGLAPSVNSDVLRRAMEYGTDHLKTLREDARGNAERMRERWSWDAVLSRSCLLDVLQGKV